MSKDKTNDEKTHPISKSFENLQCKVLSHQEQSKMMLGSVFQVLNDQSRLLKACAQLTKEARKTDLDVTVRGRIIAMIGLLSLYTDNNLEYSWKGASKIVAKTKECGANYA